VEWKDLAGKRDVFEKEAQKWKRLYTDAQAAAQKRENELTERNEHLRREESAARTQLEQTQFSLQKLEKTLKQIGDTTVYRNDAEATAAQRAALLDAYNELSQRCETLMDQLNGKSVELAELREAQEHIRGEADQRIQTMEAHLRKERDEADRARKRALQLEEDHLQLLRSFRDLNDRYIRLRQQASHVPSAENPWPPPADIVKKRKQSEF
jgi:chromosome segregation ATPase